MKDIKSLYLQAKISGNDNDISTYTEAVYDMLDDRPHDYILNLEYIITSENGLSTWNTFVEKYGLPIVCYDDVIDLFEKCSEKCKERKVSSDKYDKACQKLKDFKESNKILFDMYGFYAPENVSDYVEAYYGYSDKGYQNRKLIGGMVDKFGEAALPDALITAMSIGGKAVQQWFEFIDVKYPDNSILNEWIVEATAEEDFLKNSIRDYVKNPNIKHRDLDEWIKETKRKERKNKVRNIEKNLKDRVNALKDVKLGAIKESYLSEDNISYFELTEADVKDITDLIELREYQMACADDDEDLAHEIYEEVISLYELLDGFVTESGDLDSYEYKSKTAENELKTLGKKASTVSYDIPEYITVTVGDKKSFIDFRFRTEVSALNLKERINRDSASKAFREVPLSCYYFGKLNKDGKICGVKGIKLSKALMDYIKWGIEDCKRNNIDLPSDLNEKGDLVTLLKQLHFRPDTAYFKPDGKIGFSFYCDIDKEHGYGVNVNFKNHKVIKDGGENIAFESVEIESGDIASDIIPNLTGSNVKYDEKPVVKPNDAPGYLKNSNDMVNWGEDEDSNNKKKKNKSSYLDALEDDEDLNSNDDDDSSIEDFKRPSASSSEDKSSHKYIDTNEDDEDEKKSSNNSVNNYYYYNYTNSNNRNTNSFNKSHKSVDDHSYHSNTENKNESANPWDLDIDVSNDLILEGKNTTNDKNDGKPESDHPIRDTFQDIDRATGKLQQKLKKGVTGVVNAGKAVKKPVDRLSGWVNNTLYKWKKLNEDSIKQKMCDPHERSILYKAIRTSIIGGGLLKAGLLLNPIFITLFAGSKFYNSTQKYRLRNELISELKAELEIIDEKIEDAGRDGNRADKYKLMRLKNQINNKLLRVGGSNTRGWRQSL